MTRWEDRTWVERGKRPGSPARYWLIACAAWFVAGFATGGMIVWLLTH